MTEQTQTTQTEITFNEIEGLLEIAQDNWRRLSTGDRLLVETVAVKVAAGKRGAQTQNAPAPEWRGSGAV